MSALSNNAPDQVAMPLLALVRARSTLKRVVAEHEEALVSNPPNAMWHRIILQDARRDIASIEGAMAEQGYGMKGCAA
jgi:hypothetical protein